MDGAFNLTLRMKSAIVAEMAVLRDSRFDICGAYAREFISRNAPCIEGSQAYFLQV